MFKVHVFLVPRYLYHYKSICLIKIYNLINRVKLKILGGKITSVPSILRKMVLRMNWSIVNTKPIIGDWNKTKLLTSLYKRIHLSWSVYDTFRLDAHTLQQFKRSASNTLNIKRTRRHICQNNDMLQIMYDVFVYHVNLYFY